MNSYPIEFRKRTGAVFVLSAVGGLFMLGVVALVTDIGWLNYQKVRLQTAINASWKAGYDRMIELGGPPLDSSKKDAITTRVREIFQQNGYTASEAEAIEISFPQNKTLEVGNTRSVDLFFARVLEHDSADVNASRSDVVEGQTFGGIVPLGIPFGVVKDLTRTEFSVDLFDPADPDSGFQVDQEYILKLGSGNAQPVPSPPGVPLPYVAKQKSGYGVVDPDNSTAGGADDYRNWFQYGFNRPLQVNDRLIVQGGNESGPTSQAVDFRVEGDQNASPSNRVILPITDIGPEIALNSQQNAAAQTIYDLQGVDNPDGVYNPASYTFGSAVRIIGFAEFEIIPPEAYTREGGLIEAGDAGDLGQYQTGQVRGKFIRYIIKPGEVPLS